MENGIKNHPLTLGKRKEDIIPLAFEMLKDASNAYGKSIMYISASAQRAIISYEWRDNLQELHDAIAKAAEVCEGDTLQFFHLPPSVCSGISMLPKNSNFEDTVSNFEKELIISAIEKTNGNVFQAAKLLKTTYRIVNYKVKKYGIPHGKSRRSRS